MPMMAEPQLSGRSTNKRQSDGRVKDGRREAGAAATGSALARQEKRATRGRGFEGRAIRAQIATRASNTVAKARTGSSGPAGWDEQLCRRRI
jgi:hypothetical protein